MKLLRFIPAVACIVACAPQDVPIASRSAQFDTFPQRLFDTFETSCSGPGESFKKTRNQVFECSEFLPPKATAYLILNYDGHPQDLPQSVMRLTSTKTNAGYRVDARVFFHVPQKSGTAVEVPVESKVLDQAISELYQSMGGSPN
ncbi:hypothetical protein D1823_04820 [Ruegeria sp. AD91A]|uniref:hypothetical protein n=1 Tax=Ruegeria sp. AD91A TaxID=2293862 RepID=UPI000E474397|nr:hypothetical protein [Ruegeria sp. AD91A]AXT25958.1 hypothetical protein D1823_04820 [Ruegeria sp. AD91A]